MSSDQMTPEARKENAMMLASALGLELAQAAEALEFDVKVTADERDAIAVALAEELIAILGRTVRSIALNFEHETALIEVVIGGVAPRTSLEKVFVGVSTEYASIGRIASSGPCADIPGTLMVLTACYTCAAVLQCALKDRLPFQVPEPLVISFQQLGIDQGAFASTIELGRAYLAGAGAIGNGFLWAARHLDIRGQLDIADDDTVSSGNLNRQLWFTETDIGKPKAEQLAVNAQRYFPRLGLVPRKQRLQDLDEKDAGPWLKRVFVAVDSRRARRAIQSEFPGEVFDASTTDIREVVVHYHKEPAAEACLSCIYEIDKEENSREAHIAEHLGVSVAEVRQERISEDAAARIATNIPSVSKSDLVGLAYDTLFKQLCGEGQLKTLEGRRVVAPFAFVSVLAGTLLTLEMLKRLGGGGGNTSASGNYWRVSPWHPPLLRRIVMRPKQPSCEFCGNPILARVSAKLWAS